MEQIKEYIKNLFRGIPETPDVLRAKAELMEMMEDKYEQLLQEGKSPQEAFGTVVSEFGDLEELSEALGISFAGKDDTQEQDADANFRGFVDESAVKNGYYRTHEPEEIWDKEKTGRFLDVSWNHAFCVAGAVACFIFSPQMADLTGEICRRISGRETGIGSAGLFIMIAVGVALCLHAAHLFKRFGYRPKQLIGLDLASGELLREKRAKDDEILYKMRLTGILLLIFSVVPSSLRFVPGGIGDFLLFAMVAAGVFMLVAYGSMRNRYRELSLAHLYNEAHTSELGGGYFVDHQPRRMSGAAVALIAVSAVVVVVIVIVSVAVAVFGVVKRTTVKTWDQETEMETEIVDGAETGVFDTSDVRRIKMELDADVVRVEQSADVDQIQVSFAGKDRELTSRTDQKGNLLIEEEGDSVSLFGINSEDKHGNVIVRVPYSADALDYDIELDAGKLELVNLTAGSLKLDVDAADIRMTDCDLGAVHVEADTGNFMAKKCSFDDLRAELDMGNVQIETAEGIDSYSYSLSADAGKVQAGGRKSAGLDEAVLHGTASVTDQGTHSIRVETDLGNIEVR